MLHIRSEQMEALEQAQRRRFEDEAVAHVRSIWRDAAAQQDDDAVRTAVRRAFARAAEYGFDEEYDQLRYLNLVYALGPDFDERLPWATTILADHDRPPRSRMDELTERALAAESGEAGANEEAP